VSSSAQNGVTFETISTAEGFAALGESWDDLVRAMPRPSPRLLHAWLVAWWRHFSDDSELAVQVAYRGDRLVGALPLCVQHRHGLDVLTFLGAEQVPVADLLLASGEKNGVGAALAERAAATKHDYADFHGLPGSSRLLKALGPSRRLELIVRAEAPVLELDGVDWQTYYAQRLSSKQRALHRRRIRQLEKLGTLETTIARTRDELDPALEEAFELHSLRWEGRPDRCDFGTETGRQFHREATAAIADLDVPRIVTLRLDGRAIAFAYYFALEHAMHCYRLAFDPELQRFSPGLVNRFDTLEYAFSEGATRIEFLGGLERYKVELTDRTEPLHEGLGLADTVAGKVVVSSRLNGVRLRRFVKRSPTIRRFYYEGLAPARRFLRFGSSS
jgi:CelD/BcsL family acetyltransferase involved in cellulose biosynthesis